MLHVFPTFFKLLYLQNWNIGYNARISADKRFLVFELELKILDKRTRSRNKLAEISFSSHN